MWRQMKFLGQDSGRKRTRFIPAPPILLSSKSWLWLLLGLVTLRKAIFTLKFPCSSKGSVASMCFYWTHKITSEAPLPCMVLLLLQILIGEGSGSSRWEMPKPGLLVWLCQTEEQSAGNKRPWLLRDQMVTREPALKMRRREGAKKE